MAEKEYRIRSSRKPDAQVFPSLESPCVYRGSDFGLSSKYTGFGVRISIIDTGFPAHPDVKNIANYVDVTGDQESPKDTHGHSTMISGIIGGSNPKGITGLAPGAELYFAKAVSAIGSCGFNAVIAAILWSIVKKVDIILISLGSQTDYSVLHDAIRKAYDQNICVLAAAGTGNSGDTDYPAKYSEVLSVGVAETVKKHNRFQTVGSNTIKMVLPGSGLYTTYLNKKYTKASGSSLSAAMGAGLAALIIEKQKFAADNGEIVSPRKVYSELANLSYNPAQ